MLYVKVGHHVRVLHPFTGRTPCPSAAPLHRPDTMSECCTPSQVGHHVRVVLHPPHRSDTMSECCTPSQVGHHVRVLYPLTSRTSCPSATPLHRSDTMSEHSNSLQYISSQPLYWNISGEYGAKNVC